MFYSPDGSPINVAWGAGAVTAYTFYNLNYKIATFDTNTFVSMEKSSSNWNTYSAFLSSKLLDCDDWLKCAHINLERLVNMTLDSVYELKWYFVLQAPENIVNYVYNLTEANLTPHRRPHWFMLYDMKNSFELPDLSVQSIHNLIYSMVGDNRRLLDLYSAFQSKISDSRWPNCDDYCKINDLCRTVVTVLWERQRCDELTQIFFGS